jgi:hypothetical protein
VIPFNLKYAIIASAVLLAFTTGWVVNGWRHDAKLKESLQKTIELQKVYDDYARQVTTKFQKQQAEQVIVYRDLKRKVVDVTDNRICFADNNAVSMWNAALTGLPNTATGTSKAPTATDTATDTEVITNAIENFEQSKQIRDQLNALIDWYENNK